MYAVFKTNSSVILSSLGTKIHANFLQQTHRFPPTGFRRSPTAGRRWRGQSRRCSPRWRRPSVWPFWSWPSRCPWWSLIEGQRLVAPPRLGVQLGIWNIKSEQVNLWCGLCTLRLFFLDWPGIISFLQPKVFLPAIEHHIYRYLAVTKLIERPLPSPEVRGSNPAIGEVYIT